MRRLKVQLAVEKSPAHLQYVLTGYLADQWDWIVLFSVLTSITGSDSILKTEFPMSALLNFECVRNGWVH